MPRSRPPALIRLVDELLWALRREGFAVSTAQAVDAGRAVAAVGIDDRWRVRESLAIVLGPSARDRARFDAAFDAFFDGAASRVSHDGAWGRLLAAGFAADDLDFLRRTLEELAASSPRGASLLADLLDGDAALDRAFVRSGVPAEIGPSELPLGQLTHRLLRVAGVDAARSIQERLRSLLVAALGDRGEALARAVAREIERADDALRALVRYAQVMRARDELERQKRGALTAPFETLDAADAATVRRALRAFVQRLQQSRRVRARHAARGRLDLRKTLRASVRTGGVPFVLHRRSRPRPDPRLVVLCDVSESVRAAAALFLEVARSVHRMFDRARSFVFVSEVGETTGAFARSDSGDATALAWAAGGAVSTRANSNYGRALRSFERRVLGSLDRRTTLVILGDGRTNLHDPAADVLGRLRARSHSLLWLCPEPRAQWGLADSAMSLYAPHCSAVFEVICAEDLERAVRSLLLLAR